MKYLIGFSLALNLVLAGIVYMCYEDYLIYEKKIEALHQTLQVCYTGQYELAEEAERALDNVEWEIAYNRALEDKYLKLQESCLDKGYSA